MNQPGLFSEFPEDPAPRPMAPGWAPAAAPQTPRTIEVHAQESAEYILELARARGLTFRVEHRGLFVIRLDCSAAEVEEVREEFNTRPHGITPAGPLWGRK